MIRTFLATTALATLISTGAFAQDATTPAPAPAPAPMATDGAAPAAAAVVAGQGHLASSIIGESVYNGAGNDAQNIGDVNDIVIGDDGAVQAVVVGVGGFLGIGEKNVALDYKTLDWADQNGQRWLVVSATRESLEALPEFDTSAYEPAVATDTTTPLPSDTTAQAPAATAPAPADTTAQAPAMSTDQTQTGAIDRSTLTELSTQDMRAEDLVGTTVYGANDANVGEIGDVVLTADNKVDAYIIDVGGFLGIGEKEVAIGGDQLTFMTDADGNKYLYTSLTKEQLEAQPAYDESNWAQTRDQQRLTIQ